MSCKSKKTNYPMDYTNNRLFKCDYFETIIPHKFESEELPIPKEYDDYLTEIYGDYMKPVKYQHDII